MSRTGYRLYTDAASGGGHVTAMLYVTAGLLLSVKTPG